MANRANGRCPGCGRRGNYKQSDLCAACFKAANPTVDGVTICEHREALDLRVEDAAAALGLTPKQFVDHIEDADHAPTKAAEIIATLEAAHHAKVTKAEAANERRQPAPHGSLSAETV